MAGRGRGRGKNISFNIESLGFGRGEALPAPILQPTATYPVATFKAVPLVKTDDQEYMVRLKQDLRQAMRESPYYIQPHGTKADIQRYSDKYHHQEHELWQPDWTRLPAELQPRKKRKAKTKVVPNLKKAKRVDFTEAIQVLEQKESNEKEESEEEEEEKKTEDQEPGEEEYEESDLEEETDYNLTYFDNGEADNDDDDEENEGPIY